MSPGTAQQQAEPFPGGSLRNLRWFPPKLGSFGGMPHLELAVFILLWIVFGEVSIFSKYLRRLTGLKCLSHPASLAPLSDPPGAPTPGLDLAVSGKSPRGRMHRYVLWALWDCWVLNVQFAPCHVLFCINKN